MKLYELVFQMHMKGNIFMDMTYALAMVNNVIVLCIILSTSLRTKRYFQLSANLAVADFWVNSSALSK